MKRYIFRGLLIHKHLIKILYLLRTFLSYFFCDPCFYVTVQKFRLPYYLIHEAVLHMTLKGVRSVERSIVWHICRKSLIFASNSLEITVSFDKNLQKSIILQCCLVVTLEVSILFDMNSEKLCVVLLGSNSPKMSVLICINSLKVSELCHLNAKISQILFYKYTSELT